MKNQREWKPSKYVFRNGRLTASRNPSEVAVSSRLIADLTATFYHKDLIMHAKGRLLDLGCGKVPLYAAYRNYISDCTCVDWANSLHKNPHLDLECDLNEPLPFADGEFDTIVLSDVLEHLPNPDRVWLEMNRILREDGVILLNVPFYYWLHEEPFDYYRYTEFALRRFAETSGFRVVSIRASGGVLEIATDTASKLFAIIPLIGEAMASCAQAVHALFLRTRLGQRIAMRTATKFPLSYFMVARKN